MDFKDYYKILGVKRDVNEKDLKVAYRRLARKYHPDINKEENAHSKFVEIQEAYEVLKDPDKRREYDYLSTHRSSSDHFEPPPGWHSQRSSRRSSFDGGPFDGGFSEFFNDIFGGGFNASAGTSAGTGFARRGSDVELDLALFLEEAYSGVVRTIAYDIPELSADGQVTQKTKKIKVTIKPGMTEGQRIRLKGQGAPSVNQGDSGDLYINIKLRHHNLFDVDGHNLLLTTPIAPWEAALGGKIDIPTLDGKLRLTIPAGSQTGAQLRVKGKGLNSVEQNGDLFVVLKIVVPTEQDNNCEALWRQLEQTSNFDPRKDWQLSTNTEGSAV